MKRFFIRAMQLALFLNASLVGAENRVFDREAHIAKYKDPEKILRQEQERKVNSYGGAAFGGLLWLGEKLFDSQLVRSLTPPKISTIKCVPGNASSPYCMAMGTLNSLRRFSKSDLHSKDVLPQDGEQLVSNEQTGSYLPLITETEKSGLYYEFWRQKVEADAQVTAALGRPAVLSDYGTSEAELEGILYDAYNRRACSLYRKARTISKFGDLSNLLSLKNIFDRYSKIVSGTPYRINQCKLKNHTWEEPSEENWKKLKTSYFEKLLCENTRILRSSIDERTTQTTLGEYLTARLSMENDHLTIKRECLLAQQTLKTLSKRPEARRVAWALQTMNVNMRAVEKGNHRLLETKSEKTRAQIQESIDRHFVKARTAAKVYLRSTQKYQDRHALKTVPPKSMDELVLQLLDQEPKDAKTPPAIDPSPKISSLQVNQVPANTLRNADSQMIEPLKLPNASRIYYEDDP